MLHNLLAVHGMFLLNSRLCSDHDHDIALSKQSRPSLLHDVMSIP